jgi:hypothetical protein
VRQIEGCQLLKQLPLLREDSLLGQEVTDANPGVDRGPRAGTGRVVDDQILKEFPLRYPFVEECREDADSSEHLVPPLS